MPEVSVTDFSELARKKVEEEKERPEEDEPWANSGETIDVIERERQIAYFKLQHLEELWERIYLKYVLDAMYTPARAGDARQRVSALMRSFDTAIMQLSAVVKNHKRIQSRLEDLNRLLLKELPNGPKIDPVKMEDALAKRRGTFRVIVGGIIQEIRSAQRRVATPSWFKRLWQLITGDSFRIDPTNEARLRRMASYGMERVSVQVEEVLQLDAKTSEALRYFGLNIWSTQAEMEQRYRDIIKSVHPDSGSQSEIANKEAVVANDHRDVLRRHYAVRT